MVFFLIRQKHYEHPKYNRENQRQDNPSTLSVVAKQRFTLAVRRLCCDMTEKDRGATASKTKTKNCFWPHMHAHTCAHAQGERERTKQQKSTQFREERGIDSALRLQATNSKGSQLTGNRIINICMHIWNVNDNVNIT